MTRSFSLLLCTFASVVLAPAAYADLDELLGDWASAASQEIETDSNSDVELSPASPSDASPSESTGSTLTGIQGIHTDESTTLIHPETIDEMYSVAAPTINPHYVADSCDCGDGNCGAAKHSAHSCHSNGCQSCGEGCGTLITSGESGCIEGLSECRPHQPPNLPSSTFLQLFRSRNSYSNVWAGYAEETRLRVRNRSPHLNGTWPCDGCGALLEPNQVGCACGGGCDHH